MTFQPFCAIEGVKETLSDLIAILSLCRPHNTGTEKYFIKHWVDPLADLGGDVTVEADMYGNRWVKVGKPRQGAPNILWSCHVDTMHAKEGTQEIVWNADGKTLELRKRKPGRCLGADDGAGVFLLREMIKAGVPGTYAFHRGEERGRLGSKHVADFEPERLHGFDACIAFDRRGTADIITHQMGERGASEAFADSLAKSLWDNSDGRLSYEPDPTGSYTDSYSYFAHIAECTNVSIGYEREHGPNETLDAQHVYRLRNALVRFDPAALVIQRDPSVVEYDDSWAYGGGWHGSYGGASSGRSYTFGRKGGGWDADDNDPLPFDPQARHGGESKSWQDGLRGFRDDPDADLAGDVDPLEILCSEHPDVAASILDSLGIGLDEFYAELGVRTGSVPYRAVMG